MEEQVRTKATLLGSIKEAILAIFSGKEDVVNDIDEIRDWDDYKKNINKFSEEEREQIQEILEAESMINKRNAQVKKAKNNLKAQVKNPEKRPKMKAKVIENDENEK